MLFEQFDELKLCQKQKRQCGEILAVMLFPSVISSIIGIYTAVHGSGDWMIQPWTLVQMMMAISFGKLLGISLHLLALFSWHNLS